MPNMIVYLGNKEFLKFYQLPKEEQREIREKIKKILLKELEG